jgi:hypothetical protein
MRWTGANERTVKNWIAGTHGPSGEHLIVLAHHSNAVMMVFHQLAKRHESIGDPRMGVIESDASVSAYRSGLGQRLALEGKAHDWQKHYLVKTRRCPNCGSNLR